MDVEQSISVGDVALKSLLVSHGAVVLQADLETLMNESCPWKNGMFHITKVEGDDNVLTTMVGKVDLPISIDIGVVVCRCS